MMFTKFILAAMTLIATIIMLVFSILSGISRNKRTWRGHLVMVAGTVELLAYFVFITTTNELTAYISSTLFFTAMDVSLFLLMRFVTEYTSFRRHHDSSLWWIKFAVGIDFILCVVNIFVHFYYTCAMTEIGGQQYMMTEMKLPFLFHFFTAAPLVIFGIGLLIYKIRTSSKIYWTKYGMLVIVIAASTLLNACFLVFGWPVDLSIPLMTIIALTIYYKEIKYIPEGLVARVTKSLADGLSDAVVIVDNDDNCIYVNAHAESLIGIAVGDLDGNDILHRWCAGKLCRDTGDFVRYIELPDMIHGDKSRQLKLIYRRMMDDRGRFEGSYFQLRDLTEEINHIEQDKYRATHDALTGLYNKDRFMQLCRSELIDNPYKDHVMVMLDISNFKFINDLFGPQMGDRVLIMIAKQLEERAQKNDIYARLDNDHFGILMDKHDFREESFIDGSEYASTMMEDINFPLTLYTGVYEIFDTSLPISVMCDRAHMALENIKGNDRKKISYYTENIRSERLKRQDIVNGLDKAIADGEIQIFLQAQTDGDGISHGAEALVRWIHQDGSMVFPNDFIPVLEETGAIARLDMKVWELACEKLREWDERGLGDYYISVNISAKDFYYIDLYKCFTELTQRYSVDPGRLHLEVTETAIMKNENHQLDTIAKLQAAGFTMEMDDFGSGYSSLNMLKDIVVDVLKIDMAFLSKTENEARGRAILKLIVNMARDLDMEVIIEGVETRDQLEMLAEMGCSIYQGYYFSRPIKVSEYEERFMHA